MWNVTIDLAQLDKLPLFWQEIARLGNPRFAWNVLEPEKTDKGDEKENYKRKDYDSKTACQQKVSERLITEFRKWEEQKFFLNWRD